MTKQDIDKIFTRHESVYKIEGDIQINDDPFIFDGNLTIREDSMDVYDSKGNLKGAYALEEIQALGFIGTETSSIVTANAVSSSIITINLHPVG